MEGGKEIKEEIQTNNALGRGGGEKKPKNRVAQIAL